MGLILYMLALLIAVLLAIVARTESIAGRDKGPSEVVQAVASAEPSPIDVEAYERACVKNTASAVPSERSGKGAVVSAIKCRRVEDSGQANIPR